MIIRRKSNEWINNLCKRLRSNVSVTVVLALKTLTRVNALHAKMTEMIWKNKYFTSS